MGQSPRRSPPLKRVKPSHRSSSPSRLQPLSYWWHKKLVSPPLHRNEIPRWPKETGATGTTKSPGHCSARLWLFDMSRGLVRSLLLPEVIIQGGIGNLAVIASSSKVPDPLGSIPTECPSDQRLEVCCPSSVPVASKPVSSVSSMTGSLGPFYI